MIDRETAMRWWKYLDAAAHQLIADYADCPGQERRTPTNPRHTADCLKGDAMLCAAEVDESCRAFAATRNWPSNLPSEQRWILQHRLGCAKATLDMMTALTGGNADFLQAVVPNPDEDGRAFIEWLLLPVWAAFGDIYLDDQAAQLQTLLAPGELERLWAENPPLKG